jgi:hypothetical protein
LAVAHTGSIADERSSSVVQKGTGGAFRVDFLQTAITFFSRTRIAHVRDYRLAENEKLFHLFWGASPKEKGVGHMEVLFAEVLAYNSLVEEQCCQRC